MVAYSISKQEINQPHHSLPPALAGQISERDYVYICQRFRGMESEAYCFGLMITLVLCIFITPIALFMCPCFVSCRLSSERRRIAAGINLELYRGYQVVEANELNGIVIHTDRIPNPPAIVVAPITFVHQSQPVLIPNEYVHVELAESVATPLHENNVDHAKVTRTTVSPMNPAAVAAVEPGHNHPHPPPPRMMSVAIPANVVAGQQLRVRTPDGNFLDITLPAGINGGEDILIPY
jgi:hypothetical protein